MKNNAKQWLESTTVKLALSWLVPQRLKANPHNAIRKARVIGLLDHAGIDDKILLRLFTKALNRLPEQSEELGHLLHGLGEISARSHEDTLTPLTDHLIRSRDIYKWKEVFSAAFLQEKNSKKFKTLDIISFSQWLSTSTIGWESLLIAHSFVNRGRGPIICGYYGLSFASKIIFALDASTLDIFIRRNRNDIRIAAIGRAAIDIAQPFDSNTLPETLLKSSNSAIKCLGAAALLEPPTPFSNTLDLKNVHSILLQSGISSSDATWMTGLRLKEAIHDYYRKKGNFEDKTARLRQIRKDPASATGGKKYAVDEIESIESQLESLHDSYLKASTHIEVLLGEIASLWPTQSLSSQQMMWLENCFVGKAESRYRLAEKITQSPNCHELLKLNIDQLRKELGFSSKDDDAGQTAPSLDGSQFWEISEWAAKSQILLYKDHRRGIARMTGTLLQTIPKAAASLMKQPYIVARKPEYWSNLFVSASYAYRFAMIVATLSPPSDDINQLRQFAIDHAFDLLAYGETPSNAANLFFNLSLECIHGIKSLTDSEKTLERWSMSEELPSHVRAMALWSSPSLVSLNHELAHVLFLQTGLPSPVYKKGNECLTQLINLADIAIAAASAVERYDIIQEVVTLWNMAYEHWAATSEDWHNWAGKLSNAVTNQGSDRDWLLTEPRCSNSACAAFIKSKSTPSIDL